MQVNEIEYQDDFQLIAKYLLYLSTYAPIPVASVIDTKIKENIEKGGNAKNIAFWNWTHEQKNLLESILRRVIFTSYWSTGKTRIMFEKAKILAKEGKHVIFVLDSTKSYYPSFLYNSLLNEIKAAELSENLELKRKILKDIEQKTFPKDTTFYIVCGFHTKVCSDLLSYFIQYTYNTQRYWVFCCKK